MILTSVQAWNASMRLWPPINWLVVRLRTIPPKSPNFARLFRKASSCSGAHGFLGFLVLGSRSANVVAVATFGGRRGGTRRLVVTERATPCVAESTDAMADGPGR